MPIPPQDLDQIAAAATEGVERAIMGIEFQQSLHLGRQSIESLAHGPLADTYLRIMAELDDIEAREYVYDPAEMAVAGGWLTVDRDGHPATELGYVKGADLAALDDMRRAAMPPQPTAQSQPDDEGQGILRDGLWVCELDQPRDAGQQ